MKTNPDNPVKLIFLGSGTIDELNI